LPRFARQVPRLNRLKKSYRASLEDVFFRESNMKFQNLLGMFAVLLIALSGPSYASGHGSPPPSPPTTFIPPPIITFVPSAADIIAPTVSEPEGTESICGGSVESCGKEGENSGNALAAKVMIGIVEMELLDAQDKEETSARMVTILGQYATYGGDYLFEFLVLLVREADTIGLNEPEKVIAKLAALRSEFSLRTIKERLFVSKNNPNCDANCQVYNEAKIDTVDYYHQEFVKALNEANIPLLETRIPG
jgi:hypothetical protein